MLTFLKMFTPSYVRTNVRLYVSFSVCTITMELCVLKSAIQIMLWLYNYKRKIGAYECSMFVCSFLLLTDVYKESTTANIDTNRLYNKFRCTKNYLK